MSLASSLNPNNPKYSKPVGFFDGVGTLAGKLAHALFGGAQDQVQNPSSFQSYMPDPSKTGSYNLYGGYGGSGNMDYAKPQANIAPTGQNILGIPVLANTGGQGGPVQTPPAQNNNQSQYGQYSAVGAHNILDAGMNIAAAFNEPYSNVQDLTQKKWASQNGIMPDQIARMQANNNSAEPFPFTPEQYQNMQNEEGNYYGNLLSNTNNAMTWNLATGGTGYGSSSGGTTSGGGVDTIPNYMAAMQKAGFQADPSMPLSQVLQSNPQALLAAMQTNEGSSPKGVMNNPGNMKFTQYTASLGGVDSGVRATDGGTFASFPSQQVGSQAMLSNWNNYVKQNPNITLGDAIHKWTGFGAGPSPEQKVSSFNQYGLLSTVPGFNPNDKSYNYVTTLLSKQAIPSARDLGLTGAMAVQYPQIQKKADDLFFAATGYHIPAVAKLQANQSAYKANVKALNNLNIAEQTVTSNYGLMLDNMKKSDLGGSNQVFNALSNTWKELAGQPGVAEYLAQNKTVSQELARYLGASNANGTTVADKIHADGILNPKASLKQSQAVLSILLREGDNIKKAVLDANDEIYKTTDPFLQDPENPLRAAYVQKNLSGGTKGADGITYNYTADIAAAKAAIASGAPRDAVIARLKTKYADVSGL